MSNDAQKWLDELTQTIESEEEYLSKIYEGKRQSPCDVADRIAASIQDLQTRLPRRIPSAARYRRDENHAVFIGGTIHGMKVPLQSCRGEILRVPVPQPIYWNDPESHQMVVPQECEDYHRRTIMMGERSVVFWVSSDILRRGDDYALDRIMRWMRENGFR